MKNISIVIITWNGKHHLQKCFSSVSDYIKRDDVEVILVDNGSQDGTKEWIAQNYPIVNYIWLNENKGVAFARNRGLEKAKGKYLLILDNDTEPTAKAIEGMMDYMDKNTDIGLCGCRLIDGNGELQESCKKFPGIFEKLANIIYGRHYRYSYGKKCMEKPFSPEYLIGACQLIRREAFEDVGFLDEKIFIGPEDADFCLRIHKKGWKLEYLPQYTIIHYCQRITNKNLFSKMARRHVKSLLHLYWKYKRIL